MSSAQMAFSKGGLSYSPWLKYPPDPPILSSYFISIFFKEFGAA